MRLDRCRCSGFTLVEILVALAIAGVALVAASRAASLAAVSSGEVKLRTLAGWVAENRLAELSVSRAWPELGSLEGAEQQAGIAFHWRAEVQATPHPGFRRVEISVARVEEPERELRRLVGVVFREN